VGRRHTRKLLVEGKEDVYAIASLMSAHTPWGDTRDDWPVLIEDVDGVTGLLSDHMIPTYLKSSETDILGMVVDANESCAGRWQRICDLCRPAFPDMPKALPSGGLICDNAEGHRLGVWIMPDNRTRGMLETLLAFLVPDQKDPLWQHAQRATDEARGLKAPYRAQHSDKAKVHTWLAWQDPPGQPLGLALKSKCLDPRSPHAAPFVGWFLQLYRLERSTARKQGPRR